MKERNVIIIAHVFTTVPADDLEQFFVKHKIDRLLFIGNPLLYFKDRPGFHFRYYEKGILRKEQAQQQKKRPSLLQYVLDIFLTVSCVIRFGIGWDLIISLDNLNTISALILRGLGYAKKVIYYSIDFTPERFSNRILNSFYHRLEKYCVKHADLTWNVFSRIAEGREKLLGMVGKEYSRQVTVPIGVWYDRIPRRKYAEIDKHILVYAGGLLPHQGIQLVIDAIPEIVKTIKDFSFVIIGIGTHEKALKDKVKKMKLTKYVTFKGYFEKHEEVEELLSHFGAGAAMYSEELSKWSYYTEPSKVKSYLASGLPVFTTSLTFIAKELEDKKCGFVVDYTPKAFANAVNKLFSNEKLQLQYKRNAEVFVKDYDWDHVFTTGLKELYKLS